MGGMSVWLLPTQQRFGKVFINLTITICIAALSFMLDNAVKNYSHSIQ